MKFKDTEYGDLTGKVYLNGYIDEDLILRGRGLTSLEGIPLVVGGSLVLDDNNLTHIDYAPKQVSIISFSNNPLVSLKGLPERIRSNLFVDNTNIKNLEGIPSFIGGQLECCKNSHLESLYSGHKLVKINGIFDCSKCPKLLDPIGEIIRNQIKADRYMTDNGNFDFDFIEKEFESYVPLSKRVKRQSMRTLLGLDK